MPTITHSARAGQTSFSKPADGTVSAVTVNGVAAPYTPDAGKIVLSSAASAGDAVAVTYTQPGASTTTVAPVQSTAPTTGPVSVGTSATLIFSATTAATPRELTNTGTAPLYIGGAGVTTSTGHYVAAGAAFTPWWTGPVYGVVASGTVTVTTCA